MGNFEKCTVAMLGGPCSQHVTGNTSWLSQPQSAIMYTNFLAGVITLNGTPSSSIHIYTLQVRATDGGGLWDQADVTVNVLDPSQQPPAFTESLYQMVVAEGVSSGALVGTISAQNTNPGE